jgi:hypothetical protein
MAGHNYTDELLEENARLRAQVAELVPWAISGAAHAQRNVNPYVCEAVWANGKAFPLTPARAAELMERIDTLKLGEVNQ